MFETSHQVCLISADPKLNKKFMEKLCPGHESNDLGVDFVDYALRDFNVRLWSPTYNTGPNALGTALAGIIVVDLSNGDCLRALKSFIDFDPERMIVLPVRLGTEPRVITIEELSALSGKNLYEGGRTITDPSELPDVLRTIVSTMLAKHAAIDSAAAAADSEPLLEATAKTPQELATEYITHMQQAMRTSVDNKAEILAALKQTTDRIPPSRLWAFNQAVLVNFRNHMVNQLSDIIGLPSADSAPANFSFTVASPAQLIKKMLCDIVDKIPACAPYLANTLVRCLEDEQIFRIIGHADYASYSTTINGTSREISHALYDMGAKLKVLGWQGSPHQFKPNALVFLVNLKEIPPENTRAVKAAGLTAATAIAASLAALGAGAATVSLIVPAAAVALVGSAALAAANSSSIRALPLSARQFFGMRTPEPVAAEAAATSDITQSQYENMATQFEMYLRTVLAVRSKYFTVQMPIVTNSDAESDSARAALLAAPPASASSLSRLPWNAPATTSTAASEP